MCSKILQLLTGRPSPSTSRPASLFPGETQRCSTHETSEIFCPGREGQGAYQQLSIVLTLQVASLSLSLSLSTKIKQNALMMKLFKKKKRVKEHWEVGALQPDTL
jgi:hypothetical protein